VNQTAPPASASLTKAPAAGQRQLDHGARPHRRLELVHLAETATVTTRSRSRSRGVATAREREAARLRGNGVARVWTLDVGRWGWLGFDEGHSSALDRLCVDGSDGLDGAICGEEIPDL
jgi:hypothetical protein